MFTGWPGFCLPWCAPLEGQWDVSERSNYDRLKRVEVEVETLLADVREQVQRLRATVDRMRALRGEVDGGPTYGYGSGYSDRH